MVMQQLEKSMLSFCQSVCGIDTKNKLLVAVSGGIDSMVLLHLLHRTGFKVIVAHVNFGLRKSESLRDENFVKEICQKMGIVSKVKRFNTLNLSKNMGLSIQETARTLRYQWFEELRNSNKCDYVATAHHSDDETETFFINLLRGTGLAGLCSIPVINGKIIRPILFANRADIVKYATKNHIQYVEDSSNMSDHYLRNKVRHHLMPLLEELRSGAHEQMKKNIIRLNETQQAFDSILSHWKSQNLSFDGEGNIILNLAHLENMAGANYLLFRIIEPLGFNAQTAHNILLNKADKAKSTYISSSHCLTKHRGLLYFESIEKSKISKTNAAFYVNDDLKTDHLPLKIKLELFEKTGKEEYKNSRCAWFDASLIQYPLTYRPWRNGDRFCPFGMNGSKKVSDFFTDIKLPLTQLSKAWVLCSGEEIIWVNGMRSDNRFRVTSKTNFILKATI